MPQILLIKTTSLGDVIHNLAVASDITAMVEDAHIDWVVEDSFASIPALHPGVERVIPVAIRRWRKNILAPSTWKEIRSAVRNLQSRKYDFIIDTQGLMKSALISRRANGPVFGQDKASAREPMASRFYDHTFSINKNQHAVPRNRQLAAAVFGYDLKLAPLNYRIEANNSGSFNWIPQSRFLVFLHGTSRKSKLWPESNWIELGQLLSNKGNTILLPWGNEEEHERAQRLASAIDHGVATPQLGLDELAAVLAQSQAVVGVDTGPVHLAVALNKPTVAIYTDTDPALTGVLPMDSRRAINIGNKNKIPTAEAVYQTLQGVLTRA